MTSKNKKPAGYAINMQHDISDRYYTMELHRDLEAALMAIQDHTLQGVPKIELETIEDYWEFLHRKARQAEFIQEALEEIILDEAERIMRERGYI